MGIFVILRWCEQHILEHCLKLRFVRQVLNHMARRVELRHHRECDEDGICPSHKRQFGTQLTGAALTRHGREGQMRGV
jgi:hypothetical protein